MCFFFLSSNCGSEVFQPLLTKGLLSFMTSNQVDVPLGEQIVSLFFPLDRGDKEIKLIGCFIFCGGKKSTAWSSVRSSREPVRHGSLGFMGDAQGLVSGMLCPLNGWALSGPETFLFKIILGPGDSDKCGRI